MIDNDYKKWISLVEVGVASTGLVVFALFIHLKSVVPFSLAILGLLLALIASGKGIIETINLCEFFGLNVWTKKIFFYLTIGILIFTVGGIFYRIHSCRQVLPVTLTYVAFVSAIIGITEELFYRGYVQGTACRYSAIIGIAITGFSHTAYKIALFVLPPFPIQIDYNFFILYTLIGNLILSILREFAKNSFPSICAHAVFDIVVYGDFTDVPWWVWS